VIIRDPTDGSIREVNRPAVSGLAPEDRQAKDYAKRLDHWRVWLKDYLLKKGHHHERITATPPQETTLQPGS